jgi:iron complex outermembrane receptor protein
MLHVETYSGTSDLPPPRAQNTFLPSFFPSTLQRMPNELRVPRSGCRPLPTRQACRHPLCSARGFALATLLAGGLAVVEQAAAQGAAPSQSLPPTVVTATRSERLQLDVPASVELIDADAIRDAQLRVNLSESLVRVPGIVVLNRQNYAQDLQISIRGFGSRASFGVRGVRLYVDGVPASFPDGQGQVSHFPLNLADRIEVLRGPFSALYGNSSGGVIALSTQLTPQEPKFELSAAAGSDSTYRVGFTAKGGVDPYAFALDVGRFETDGTRAQSAALRDSMTLRVAFLDSPLGRLRLSLNSLAMPDSQDPLGLTRAQWQADPSQASPVALQFNTRKTTRQNTLGADVQSALPAGLTLTSAAWIGTRAVTQYQAIPVQTQAPVNHPGGVIDFDRGFGGADLRLGREWGDVTAHLGVAAERLNEDRRGFNNYRGTGAAQVLGVQGDPRRDERNVIESLDPYAQAEWRVGERWRLHAGVRASQVKFRSTDRYIVGTNLDDSGETDFSAVNPTAGVVFRPSATTSLYASYGRGFETPTLNELAYRPDGSAGFNTALMAARSNNVEVGAKLAASGWRAGVALFSVRTRDDIVVRTNAGGRSAFGNAARTSREGIELSAAWTPSERWSWLVAGSVLRARFDQGFLTCGAPPCLAPTLPVAEGNRLPGVPEKTLYSQIKHRIGATDLTLDWRLQSTLYVDDRNTDRAPGYGVLSLAAAHSFSVGERRPRVFARVDNVLDRRYAGSVIVNEANGRFFEPAPGRTWLAGVDWPF